MCFANLSVYLGNEFIADCDKLPAGVSAAYHFLENWLQRETNMDNPPNDGVGFTPGRNLVEACNEPASTAPPKTLENLCKVYCYGCGKFGHIKDDVKCKPEDIDKLKAIIYHMAVLSRHGNNENGDEYQVAICPTHVCEVAEDAEDKGVSFCMKRNDQQKTGHLLDHKNELI